MEYSCQSLHRLPVLNWDDDIGGNDKHEDFKSIHGNNVRYTDVTRNVKKNELQKEKADVKNPKYKLRRKPISTKNLKGTLSFCSSFIQRLLHHSSAVNSSRKYKKKRPPSRQTNQVEVLFSSKARKLKNKLRDTNQDLIDDMYGFNANRRENFKNISDRSHVYIKYRPNVHRCEVSRINRQHISERNASSRWNCDNLHKINPKSSYDYDLPAQYKVIQFPNYDQTDTEIEAINRGGIEELDHFQYQTENVIGTEKERQLDAPLPCVSDAQRGGGDACNISIQCSAAKRYCTRGEKFKNIPHLNNGSFQRFLDPLIIHENALCLAKITLKYLIFGLVLIVWCPCIATLYFCWFVTYPLRPRHTITGARRSSRCPRKSQAKVYVRGSKNVIDNSIQTCENNIWSFFLKGISWAYHPIAMSFGAFKSLLNWNTNNLLCFPSSAIERSGNKDRVMTSDYKKKYTLYYNRSKGWVMKSSKVKSKKNNNITCNYKHDPNLTHETHPVHPDDRKQVAIRSLNHPCSCRAHTRKYFIDKNMKSCLPGSNRNRYKHLCADTSGLPVHVKLTNPMFNSNYASKRHNVKPINKKNKSFPQRPFQTREQLYKKRLRCKGSRQQSQLLTQAQGLRLRHKIWQYCNEIKCNIKSVIDDVEAEVFGDDHGCTGIYIHTLRRKPWHYVYRNCPSFYPMFIGIYKFYENVCHFFLLFVSACIWCPLLAFCYLCYGIICRSL